MPKGRPNRLTATEREILSVGAVVAARTGTQQFWAFEIQKFIKNSTDRTISWGTLFPALRRLERMGYVTAEWSREEETGKRPRRYYTLTEAGEREAGASPETIRSDIGRPVLRSPV